MAASPACSARSRNALATSSRQFAAATDRLLREHKDAGRSQSARCGCVRCAACIRYRRLARPAAFRRMMDVFRFARLREMPAMLQPSLRSAPALAEWLISSLGRQHSRSSSERERERRWPPVRSAADRRSKSNDRCQRSNSGIERLAEPSRPHLHRSRPRFTLRLRREPARASATAIPECG